ncbi:MAG: coproporphyrinogen III oxidase family protein [Campylobacter sp.]|nr:coproporphyrinogen III oxidase family protein [Campylobacter sp.]
MHIYIHIPFCQSKCPYCAFGSSSNEFNKVENYFNALASEIKKTKISEISTLFIGGGTPSAVKAELYKPIFEILSTHFKARAEITSEANPNSANLKWLKKMRSFGVNRISFGAQSFNDKKLILLGRTHSVNDTKEAILNAKKAGFSNINLDIIYSTKLDNKKILDLEVENLTALKPSHISAYSLILEEKTPFEGKINLQKDSVYLSRYLFKKLEKAGFKQYEISNFGRPCRHNLAYWKGKKYLGFGAYAVGFDGKKRIYSPKDIDQYIKNPLEKKIENLSSDDIKIEQIFLGLRSKFGFNAKILDKFQLEKAQILTKNKKLLYKKDKFYNPNFLLADEITLFILDSFK